MFDLKTDYQFPLLFFNFIMNSNNKQKNYTRSGKGMTNYNKLNHHM